MIDIVLPALNERDALPGVLASLPPGFRPIVVDNGSSDGTGAIASGLGADVVVEPRRGFGAACFAGLCVARTEVVCFMDCDGSLVGTELPLVCAPVVERHADLVLGARRPERRRDWPLHARTANAVLARVVSHRTGATLSDLGPMRAARREPLLGLGIVDRRFGWPLEMVLRAGRAGWRIREVPVTYRARVGRSKVTGTVRGTARAVVDMTRALP
jgi:glycosyltransferase involved in cell wall biosynthesis